MTSSLITYPLTILIFASIISGLSTISSLTWNTQFSVGSPFTLNILGYTVSFTIGVEEILLLLTVVGAIGVIAGISIFGSGLSTMSQAILYKSVFYFSLWSAFSVLSITTIVAIPFLGSIIWLCLTLFYIIGVQEQIGTHPS